MSVVLYVTRFNVDLLKFLLGLDNIYFENYFANELIKMGRFFNQLKYSQFVDYASCFISDKALLLAIKDSIGRVIQRERTCLTSSVTNNFYILF